MDSSPEVEVGDIEVRRASEDVSDEQAEADQREILEPEEAVAELVDQPERLSETQEWVEVIRRESDLVDVSSGQEDASEGEIDLQGMRIVNSGFYCILYLNVTVQNRLSHCCAKEVFSRQDPNRAKFTKTQH